MEVDFELEFTVIEGKVSFIITIVVMQFKKGSFCSIYSVFLKLHLLSTSYVWGVILVQLGVIYFLTIIFR